MYKNWEVEATPSDIIKALRLPLTILVVMIHSDTSRILEYSSSAVYYLSTTLTAAVVPSFFLISGYLFSPKKFSIKNYVDKLKSRFFTLFIPYIAWGSIAYIIFYKAR